MFECLLHLLLELLFHLHTESLEAGEPGQKGQLRTQHPDECDNDLRGSCGEI